MPLSLLLDINDSSLLLLALIFLVAGGVIFASLKLLLGKRLARVKGGGLLLFIASLLILCLFLYLHYLITGKGILQ